MRKSRFTESQIVGLVSTDAVVYEVPGRLTKRHRMHSTRTGKSDPIDARSIAEVVLRESDRLGRYYGSAREILEKFANYG